MMTFKVRHNYCGMEKTIKGNNVWDALKSNGLDYRIWTVLEVEFN